MPNSVQGYRQVNAQKRVPRTFFLMITSLVFLANMVSSFTVQLKSPNFLRLSERSRCSFSSNSFHSTRQRESTDNTQTMAHYRSMPSCLFMAQAVGKSGARIIESEEDFLGITSNLAPSELPTLLFFTAPWCGPCRLSNPVVKEIMKQFTGKIDVLEVCTDDLPDVAANANVVSIPTIQIYHEGKCLDTIVGCVAKNVLANAVQKILDDIEER